MQFLHSTRVTKEYTLIGYLLHLYSYLIKTGENFLFFFFSFACKNWYDGGLIELKPIALVETRCRNRTSCTAILYSSISFNVNLSRNLINKHFQPLDSQKCPTNI